MKITFKEFHEEPFEIKTTNRNMRRAINLQLAASKIDDTKGKDLLQISKDTMAFFDTEKAFFVDILGLNDDQAEAFEDLDFGHTMEMLGYLIVKMQNNGQADSVPETKSSAKK
ncbi:hypothetical protein ATX57_10645 [Oenococcus oeni]|uniref:phage tail tube assembly chaperone n=1 Tax=Oenococcus oeni TaxID=1247 RepID=UPI0008F89E86|nr:phage tail tube assembly chaperone [Oenococcus oeni]OIM14865.1 hypothetical protein ATX57_10645 [Oenococcus oeni]